MKALFIFLPFSLEERYGRDVGEAGGFLPPLGMCYIAAVLERAGIEVELIDAAPDRLSDEQVLEKIQASNADFIGITAITPAFHRVVNISHIIKEKMPEKFLAIGGPHASCLPEETLEKTGADLVIVGESEEIIADIVKNCKSMKRGEIVHGRPVMDLDSLPFPARHLLDMKKYSSLPNDYKLDEHNINLIVSRGCPYNCTFCCKPVVGRNYRMRSVGNVISEIKQIIKGYGTKELCFWDDIFTVNRKWVFDFCDALRAEDIRVAWSCYTRANLVDRELLAKMKEAGCWNIFFGIEAGDQTLLDIINKQITLDQLRQGIKLTKEAGIEIRGSFILGLPGETPELARKTIKFAIELDTDYPQFCFTTPFPGTKLRETALQYGTILENDYSKYGGWIPTFLPFGYKSVEELQKMQKLAFRKVYLRPSYIIRRIAKIRSIGDLKRNLKGARMVLGFT